MLKNRFKISTLALLLILMLLALMVSGCQSSQEQTVSSSIPVFTSVNDKPYVGEDQMDIHHSQVTYKADLTEGSMTVASGDFQQTSESDGSTLSVAEICENTADFELPDLEADAIAQLPQEQQESAVIQALEQSPLYDVSVDTEGNVEVKAPYAEQRLLVVDENRTLDVSALEPVQVVEDDETSSMVLSFDSMQDTWEAFEELDDNPEVDVLVDMPVQLYGTSKDYDGWGLSDMRLDLAEDKLDAVSNKETVTVAVLDTGVRSNHAVFGDVTFDSKSGSFLSSYRATPTSTSFEDGNGHGTLVSSIVASGTPSNVRLMELKCMDDEGMGSIVDIYYATLYAARNGANVVNMSLGLPLSDSRPDQTTKRTFDKVLKLIVDEGGLVITAASNEGQDLDAEGIYPASSQYAIAVSALSSSTKIAAYSNYGTSVEFTAPGSNIKGASHTTTQGTTSNTGTSFSTPHISAFLASLKTVYPSKTMTELIAIMKTMCVDLGTTGKDAYYGYGKPVFDLSIIPESNNTSQTTTPEPTPDPTPSTPEPTPTPTPSVTPSNENLEEVKIEEPTSVKVPDNPVIEPTIPTPTIVSIKSGWYAIDKNGVRITDSYRVSYNGKYQNPVVAISNGKTTIKRPMYAPFMKHNKDRGKAVVLFKGMKNYGYKDYFRTHFVIY